MKIATLVISLLLVTAVEGHPPGPKERGYNPLDHMVMPLPNQEIITEIRGHPTRPKERGSNPLLHIFQKKLIFIQKILSFKKKLLQHLEQKFW